MVPLIAKISIMVVISVLCLAVLADFGSVTIGGLFTADTYYLPLREIDLGDAQDEVEQVIIDTHTKVLARQRALWFALHILALVAASVSLISVVRLTRRTT